ncbi:hypothetical protein CCACVL1_04824 [Corchorus capsularis]|uniref:Uncharacterized protein n=1 Tax=Corchorus capsularis TaxID=210143 RepID=A0A1R3JPH4_COCAP|nr:hypothetical protein CCACVL1_04824 [Corchorus capsularis]
MGFLRLLVEKLQNSKKKGYEEVENNFDPDDPETMDMLCGLPAEKVWEIRKGLCDLIQSPEFASNKYLERAPPIVFLQFGFPSTKFLYLDDDDNKRVLVDGSPLLKKLKFPFLVASCNGLLLFESVPNFETIFHYSYYIWNPVTQQVVNLSGRESRYSGRIYGLYYHSSTQEYRLLYLRNNSDGFVQDYGIIKAGQNAGRRLYLQAEVKNNFPRPRAINSTKAARAPVLVKNFLYWMAAEKANGANNAIKFVSFRNNEVLLVWSNRGVFRYDLSTWNARKVDLKGMKLQHVNLVAHHTKSVVVLEDQRDGLPIYFETREQAERKPIMG